MSGDEDTGDEDTGGAGAASRRAAKAKWNARYAFSGDAVPPPAEVLSRYARWLPEAVVTAVGAALPDTAPTALDLACGRAGNGEWLAVRGFRVSAWDISESAIAAIRERPARRIVRTEVRDVVARPPPPASFDVIVVARFLDRASCPAIAAALRPGGVLFYQTFTHGLANPDYLLAPNELPALFPTLEVCAHREPPPDASGRAEAMLVARRPVPAAPSR